MLGFCCPAGGWHPDDHAEFERILRACRGSYSHCVELCTQELSLLHSGDGVAAHASWHQRLAQLAAAKKLAVQCWRAARRAEQALTLNEQQQRRGGGDENGSNGDNALEQAEREAKERQRAELAEWKAARRAAVVQERQSAAQAAAERREQEARALRQRQEHNRQRLAKAQAAKLEAERSRQSVLSAESSQQSISSDNGPAVDPATRQRLQRRSQQLLQRRAEASAKVQQAVEQRAAQLRQLAEAAGERYENVPRDPLRLLRATSAAAMRQLATVADEHAPKDSGYIRHAPRLATPAWLGGRCA
jgi:hypothetical protein